MKIIAISSVFVLILGAVLFLLIPQPLDSQASFNLPLAVLIALAAAYFTGLIAGYSVKKAKIKKDALNNHTDYSDTLSAEDEAYINLND